MKSQPAPRGGQAIIAVSHKFKLIHVHIPKTGGSSINAWLEALDPEIESLCPRPHEPVSNLVRYSPAEMLTYHVFCVVRNPWARAVSLYHYRKKTTNIQPPHWPSRSDINTLSFRNTVLKSESQSPELAEKCPPSEVPEIAWLEPSCSAWVNIDGKLAVNQVCRLESIHKDIGLIGEKIGCDVPAFPHKNSSQHTHYSEYYDEETRAIIAKKCKEDIDCFGYAFGD